MTQHDVLASGSDNGASIPKAATGIEGVDEILFGGVPRGRTTLVAGSPGAGKTIFGLEFLYRGALAGEPGIHVTFEEHADSIRRNARAMGFDVEAKEADGLLALLQANPPISLVQSGEFDFGGLLGILSGRVEAIGARRIVIDAVDVLLRLFREPYRQTDQLVALHNWLVQRELTTVITAKEAGLTTDATHALEHMVDCLIRLDQRVLGQVATRRLRVVKYRGSGFLSNEYPFVIAPGGMSLMPVSRFDLPHRSVGPQFATGIDGLDRLLMGGLRRGSCVLIAGASGTGKTTVAASVAAAACERGEKVLYVSFEESIESLVWSMSGPGIDLGDPIKKDCLGVLTAMPEAMGVEEHLWRIARELDRFEPQHLVLDSISACRRFGSEEAAFDFLVRLLTLCKSRGITCLYLNQTEPESAHQISGIGISSLVDAIVILEQDWPGGSHRRRLLVLKARGSRHSHAAHTFRITDDGIAVGSAPTSTSTETVQP